MNLKEILDSREFQRFADIMRILLFVALVALIFVMLSEIETVKILGSDVCKICMNKTGCSCTCLKPLTGLP